MGLQSRVVQPSREFIGFSPRPGLLLATRLGHPTEFTIEFFFGAATYVNPPHTMFHMEYTSTHLEKPLEQPHSPLEWASCAKFQHGMEIL
jgi:hypothetical protein